MNINPHNVSFSTKSLFLNNNRVKTFLYNPININVHHKSSNYAVALFLCCAYDFNWNSILFYTIIIKREGVREIVYNRILGASRLIKLLFYELTMSDKGWGWERAGWNDWSENYVNVCVWERDNDYNLSLFSPHITIVVVLWYFQSDMYKLRFLLLYSYT